MSLEELVKACAEDGREEDWQQFVLRFHGVIATVALRTARRWGNSSTGLVDDLIQETYLKICSDPQRLWSAFQPGNPESFAAYLRVITANTVHDHFRSRHAQKHGSGKPEVSLDEIPTAAPATMAVANTIHRNILLREVDEALSSGLSGNTQSRDRLIFWLYYRHGLTALAIAELPSISLSVKGVESVIHKLTRAVRERLAERKKAPEIFAGAKGSSPKRRLTEVRRWPTVPKTI